MCNQKCSNTTCPFAYTFESETIQNYGCLPTPPQIVYMRTEYGKTWACHSNPTVPCVGGIAELKRKNLPHSTLELITEDDPWHLYIPERDKI